MGSELILFDLILVCVIGMVIRGASEPGQRWKVAVVIAGWLAALSAFVASGKIAESPMPFLAIFFLVSNLGAVAFAMSPLGKRVARNTPFAVLVAFQGFRLPLELVLHGWAADGVIPETMTWTGQNWDILTGFAAAIAAPFAARRNVVWAFNILGFALLLNVMRVAIMSSPLPFSWQLAAPLTLGFQLPQALIVPVCVAGALAGHIVLTRKLLSGNASN